MPQAVRAVMEHPSLTKTSYELLDLYCKMFELDWRGDRSVNNKKEYMSTNPVYVNTKDGSNFNRYGEIGNFEAKAMIRNACIPFMNGLATDLVKAGSKRQY